MNTGTTGTTGTTGHVGVLGKIKNAIDPNVNTTGGATTDVGHTGHHHDHIGRDAAIAGGGVGLFEHHRNTHPSGGATGTTGAYDNTTGTTGTTGAHHHHTARDGLLAGGAVAAEEHHHNKHHPLTGTTGNAGNANLGAGYGNSSSGEYNTTSGGYGTGAGVGAGTGAGLGAGGMAGGTTSNVNPSAGHAGGTNLKGKIQEAIGNVTHSQNLQAKGIANQQQAQAEKFQRSEITEAERLEGNAKLRRDNAVASGAHPTHGTAGGAL